MQKLYAFALWLVLFMANALWAEEPSSPPPQQPSSPAQEASKGESDTHGKKHKSLPPYLIIGTVFNENALSYPKARVQIRQAGEKKFRWDTYTNSQGEFALRVPDGQEYELVVREKKYKEVSLKIDAKSGGMQERLSIRLEALNPEKDGAKK